MRFVIISVPPQPIADAIEAFRRPINEQVGASEALRYPPHITLRTGLVCPDDKAALVANQFLAFAEECSAVEVSTAGLFFSAYGEPPRGMVGWSVPMTSSLVALHERLLGFRDWAKGPQGPYQPHLSLCYGDLTVAALESLRKQSQLWQVPDWRWTLNHVGLYYEKETGWVEWSSVRLKSSA